MMVLVEREWPNRDRMITYISSAKVEIMFSSRLSQILVLRCTLPVSFPSPMMPGKGPEIAPSPHGGPHNKRKKPDDDLPNGANLSSSKKQRTRVRFVKDLPLRTGCILTRTAFRAVNAIDGNKRCATRSAFCSVENF